MAAAESAPGVVLVMTHRNAPRLNPPPGFLTAEKAAAGDSLPVMQDDRVHWNGQPIALMLAYTQEQADHACSLIRATYETEQAVTVFEEAKARGSQQGAFAGHPLAFASGDAEVALATAPHKVDSTYTTHAALHDGLVAGNVAAARFSSLRQAVGSAAGDVSQV